MEKSFIVVTNVQRARQLTRAYRVDGVPRLVRVDGNETYRRISNCTVNETVIARWYRNLKSIDPFDPNTTSLDYSLQLALGIANWKTWSTAPVPSSAFSIRHLDRSRIVAPAAVGEAAPASRKLPAQEGFRRGD